MLKVFRYLKKREWLFILLSIGFIVAQVWLDLRLPDYMTDITRLIQTGQTTAGDILVPGGKMLLCAVGSMTLAICVGFFASQVAAGLAMRLRGMVFDKTLSFSMEEINKFSTASLITRTTNDITQVQFVIAMGLQALVKAPILAVWAVIKIADKNFEWTLATGCAVGVLLLMMMVILLFVVPKFRRIQGLTDNLNRVTRENLTGLRVVRAYNAEKYQEEKFQKANDELTGTQLFTSRMMAIVFPTMSLILSGLTLAIYWIGTYLINEAAMMDKLTLFSNMVVFSSYAMQVIMAFMLIAMIFVLLPRADVAAKRIMEVIGTGVRILDGELNQSPEGHVGEVEFRDVSFKYPDAEDYVLHHISFRASKGETVAFIGSTGCGKSTLINLVPRFFDATDGNVLVDGIDVREYTQEALHNKIGYVPQRAVLFSGTVATNVSYGDNGKEAPDMDGIREAVAISQGADFVDKMEQQYESHIAQGGTNISGGQKQRLSIARAVCKRPEIYVFDDSFSALDYRTDRALRSALKNEIGDATILIVAQRIGTILDADRIIVLEDGEAVGIGTHRELLKSCKVYQEIARSQLSEEELDIE